MRVMSWMTTGVATALLWAVGCGPANARKAAPDIKPLNPILMPRLPVFTDNLATCRVDFAAAYSRDQGFLRAIVGQPWRKFLAHGQRQQLGTEQLRCFMTSRSFVRPSKSASTSSPTPLTNCEHR